MYIINLVALFYSLTQGETMIDQILVPDGVRSLDRFETTAMTKEIPMKKIRLMLKEDDPFVIDKIKFYYNETDYEIILPPDIDRVTTQFVEESNVCWDVKRLISDSIDFRFFEVSSSIIPFRCILLVVDEVCGKPTFTIHELGEDIFVYI